MGRIWGPGGWVGPGSRLENRTYLRWFRFLLGFLLGSLTVFLLGYFGWSSDRTEHELVPSLLRALLGGMLWGLGMAAYLGGPTIGRDGNEKASVGLLYKGKRERPPTRTRRWQLVVAIAVMVIAVTAALLGLRAPGPAGRSPLSSVLGHGAILIVIAIGYVSMRHQRSIRQRRFHAALVVVLALLWLIEVVGYLVGWR